MFESSQYVQITFNTNDSIELGGIRFQKVQLQIQSSSPQQLAYIQQIQIKSCYIRLHILRIMVCVLSISLEGSRNVTITTNEFRTESEREEPWSAYDLLFPLESYEEQNNKILNLNELDNYRQLVNPINFLFFAREFLWIV